MNRYIKYGLIFAAGLGIGGGISWLINKKKFNDRLEEELEKNQEYYIQLLGYSEPNGADDLQNQTENGSQMEIPEVFVGGPQDETSESQMTYTEKMNQKKENLRNKSRIRYDKIPDAYNPEKEVDDIELAINNDRPDQDIVIITSDQYAKEHLKFDKETILWWEKENILSTEDYEPLDVPDLIGTEWINRIGEFEKDVVYVRNYIAETDYEIVRQHDSFYDYQE